MLVSDIISRVRNIAGDVEKIQFSDATIMQWINDGMREAASDNNLLQVTGTTPTVAGTNKYDIPADILKLHSIRHNGDDLRVVTLDEAQQAGYLTSEQGSPTAAWVWAGKITLYPTPAAAGSLEIDYIKTPTDVTNTGDTPIIPAMYHMRLVDYCLAQVAQQDDDLNRYQMKMEEFRTGVQNLKDQPEWEQDEYPYIGVASRDMGDWDVYYDG